MDIRDVTTLSIECMGHERCEHVRDKDGLQNHCALKVVPIRYQNHKIYKDSKRETDENHLGDLATTWVHFSSRYCMNEAMDFLSHDMMIQ